MPVSRLSARDISGVAKQVEHVDPRFADYAGEVYMAIYRRIYGFINELKQQEIEGLKKYVLLGILCVPTVSLHVSSFNTPNARC